MIAETLYQSEKLYSFSTQRGFQKQKSKIELLHVLPFHAQMCHVLTCLLQELMRADNQFPIEYSDVTNKNVTNR